MNAKTSSLPDRADRILPGFRHLTGFLGNTEQRALMQAIERVVAAAPLYRPSMPRTGKSFSVRMTNCGQLGWVSDRHGGYRYQVKHPVTGRPWPTMPRPLIELWHALADYPELPEACLVNHYEPGTKLGSHVDSDEAETAAPVISISLGDDAIFHIGGRKRADPRTRMRLRSGDIIILGGPSRLAHHGIDRIVPGTSDLVAIGGRINLTIRRVTIPA